ncbi:hypothetical protein ACFWNE_07345 [Streptomyces goshikiensis]|uniref:hypothetical protein n=1 Tax=Streptomyces goshikiensis TaxID=1942 RepID=UPI0036498219
MTERTMTLADALARAQEFLADPDRTARDVVHPKAPATLRLAYTGGIATGLLSDLVTAIQAEQRTTT